MGKLNQTVHQVHLIILFPFAVNLLCTTKVRVQFSIVKNLNDLIFLSLSNVAPMWNENSQVYQLDFGGRVTQESAKNFQIEFRGKQVSIKQ